MAGVDQPGSQASPSGAGHDGGVAVGVSEPELAVAGAVALAVRGVAVRRADDRRGQAVGPGDHGVEVGDLAQPDQHPVADGGLGVADRAVVVLDVRLVQLQHQDAVGQQPLVVGPAVVADQAEQVLVPAAGGLDVADGEHGLGLRRPGHGDQADPVAGRVVDLGQPALALVEPGPAPHGAAGRGHRVQGRPQPVDADPQDRPAGRRRGQLGGPLADHPRRLEAAVLQVGLPAEHRPVEGRRGGDVQGGQLQVADLAVGRVAGGASGGGAHGVSSAVG
jgi:hypothetical protein